MKKVKLILLGLGTVGSGFIEILQAKKAFLTKHNIELVLLAAASSKEVFYNANGLNLENMLHKKDQDKQGKSVEELLQQADYDILIECTPTNLTDGEPGLTYLKLALNRGKAVFTANKGPIALAYDKLKEIAKTKKTKLKIESTVLVGTPVFSFVEKCLPDLHIQKITAILNGTTNYIIGQMEKGIEYAEALKNAQKLGYAETNPDADVLGYDSLAKTIILANILMNGNLSVKEIPFMGIDNLKLKDVLAAKKENKFFKLVGEITKKNNAVAGRVVLKKVPHSSPLSNVLANQNAILLETEDLGELMITGPGAGKRPTAYGLFCDVFSFINEG